MFGLFHHHTARANIALPDFAGAVQSIMRRLSLPKQRAGEKALELLETVSVSAQASVVLIRFKQETLVLGVTPQNVSVLTRSITRAASDETQAGSR